MTTSSSAYAAKNYDRLLGTSGFSDQLLKNHFTLYGGYVTNTNKVSDTLLAMVKEGKQGNPEFAELKRRFGWEFNGMRLHELYFDNMVNGGAQLDGASNLARKINETYGDHATWEKDFRGTGAMRGIGWTIMVQDNQSGKIFNTWVNEHDVGHLATCTPLLILDVFEHAFMIDYGLRRADYIEAFVKAIDWKVVQSRFK